MRLVPCELLAIAFAAFPLLKTSAALGVLPSPPAEEKPAAWPSPSPAAADPKGEEKVPARTVWLWGRALRGQIGIGDQNTRGTNVIVKPKQLGKHKVDGVIDGRQVLECCCGMDHTLVRTEPFEDKNETADRLFGFGDGSHGQTGLQNTYTWPTPQEVTWFRKAPEPGGKFPKGNNMQNIFCGGMNSAVVDDQGVIYTWGWGNVGQLGRHNVEEYTPRKVKKLYKERVKRAAIGLLHMLVLTESGLVYSWGDNSFGQIGSGVFGKTATKMLPYHVLALSGVTQVAAGCEHSMALTEKGQVFSWGSGKTGQLGHEDWVQYNAPKPIDLFDSLALKDVQVTTIKAGCHHSLAITSEGGLYAWGWNYAGQLGLGDRLNRPGPRLLQVFKGKAVKQVAGGREFTLVLLECGDLYSMGTNEEGQLGALPETKMSPYPVNINMFNGRGIRRISAGSSHACIIVDEAYDKAAGGPKCSKDQQVNIMPREPAGVLRISAEPASSDIAPPLAAGGSNAQPPDAPEGDHHDRSQLQFAAFAKKRAAVEARQNVLIREIKPNLPLTDEMISSANPAAIAASLAMPTPLTAENVAQTIAEEYRLREQSHPLPKAASDFANEAQDSIIVSERDKYTIHATNMAVMQDTVEAPVSDSMKNAANENQHTIQGVKKATDKLGSTPNSSVWWTSLTEQAPKVSSTPANAEVDEEQQDGITSKGNEKSAASREGQKMVFVEGHKTMAAANTRDAIYGDDGNMEKYHRLYFDMHEPTSNPYQHVTKAIFDTREQDVNKTEASNSSQPMDVVEELSLPLHPLSFQTSMEKQVHLDYVLPPAAPPKQELLKPARQQAAKENAGIGFLSGTHSPQNFDSNQPQAFDDMGEHMEISVVR